MPPPTTPRVPHQTPLFEAGEDSTPEAVTIAERLKELKMSRTWIIFLERLGNWLQITEQLGGAGELKATFNLNRPLSLTTTLTLHFICRTGGTFTDAVFNARIPPEGQNARITLEKSTNGGSTWNTILAAPGYLELAAGNSGVQEFTGVFLTDDNGTIAPGNLLRIGCSQVGSSAPGKSIAAVLSWE